MIEINPNQESSLVAYIKQLQGVRAFNVQAANRAVDRGDKNGEKTFRDTVDQVSAEISQKQKELINLRGK